jgi:hypothetical protein
LSGFLAYGNRRLKRGGARGSPVRVSLGAAWLDITGEDPTPLRLPFATIERMRSGYTEVKGGPNYQTILWPAGDTPITLAPLREDRLPYAALVRTLAARVAASRGPRAVERGDTAFGALFGPVTIGLLLIAALGVCAYALADHPFPLRWLPALVPALIFGLLTWRYHAVHRPRPVRDLAELDRQLPR